MPRRTPASGAEQQNAEATNRRDRERDTGIPTRFRGTRTGRASDRGEPGNRKRLQTAGDEGQQPEITRKCSAIVSVNHGAMKEPARHQRAWRPEPNRRPTLFIQRNEGVVASRQPDRHKNLNAICPLRNVPERKPRACV